ncbi:ATP-dependent DNA helicase [Actinotalea sp. K2]|uniref:ATP-dependent DNA helicase n=1 Tax=Actinotalea sp. K2 TaxID=2939438 RepID=UPI0020181069|nr:ATP-dependent DNA helicase [Actinotalea sp. K2]MCL3859859.1 ATP-dependent helicase [Actinotalea sp. K2]
MSQGPAYSAERIAGMLGIHPPTPEQTAVIEGPLEPVLVVAGAGSGKTETMAARVVHLIANGLVAPERVLGLTFTRKAAGELSERVRHRLRGLRVALGDDRGRRSSLVAPTISTYNSYAAGLVGDHALRLGLEPSSQLLGEAGRWQVAHGVVEQWSEDLDVDLAPATVTQAVLDLAGSLAEHLVDPEQLRSEAERLVEVITRLPGEGVLKGPLATVQAVQASLGLRARLVDLVVEFVERKRQADMIDFADQVALAARLAREVPEVGAIERARFGVVLLDEYQDTSVAQLELLRHLFGAGDPAGAGHPVTAVGDPHQSIYGWRGASAGGLARFPVQFPSRTPQGGLVPARRLVLPTSWRNDRAVLDAANQVAAPLRQEAGSGPHGLDLPLLAPRPGAGEGAVAACYLETHEDEARAVAEFVRSHWEGARHPDQGPATPGGTVRAAVLCRKRSQFPVMQAALLAAGLPVEVVGLGGLLSTPEVVDLVAALEAAHDPSRGDSLMRLLTGPRARLGLSDLHALADWSAELGGPGPRANRSARAGTPGSAPDGAGVQETDVVDERSIVDALDALPRPGWQSHRGRSLSETGRARLEDLSALLSALRSQTFLPVVDLVTEAERLLGLDIEVAVRPGVAPATARANLDAFRSVAAAFSDSSDASTLGAFLAWLDTAQREERGLEAPVGEMDPDAVQLLTVHASKGLEWDVVAVPGMVEGSFPTTPRTSGWIKEHGSLPTSLRGDRDSLPDIDLSAASDITDLARRCDAFKDEHAAHHLFEERRLAYVALTRARSALLLSGSWWREGKRPTPPSRFLVELVDSGVVGVDERSWVPDPAAPDEDGRPVTPVRPEPVATDPPLWPPTDAFAPDRQVRVEQAAVAVRAAQEDLRRGRRAEGGTRSDLELVAELLLDERRRGRTERSSVALPAHLSTSSVVRLAGDADTFARQLRRPVPLAPSVHARRGTAFHAWVESYYGSAALVDVDELPGADDESVEDGLDLTALQQAFLASPWAGRTPLAIEVDIETPLAEVMVRSRIDAVFGESDGGVVVVDWKSGRPPREPAQVRAREVQLAVYRLAWSRWKGVPLETVRAAFFYAATGETIRPDVLLDAHELEALIAGTPTPRAG